MTPSDLHTIYTLCAADEPHLAPRERRLTYIEAAHRAGVRYRTRMRETGDACEYRWYCESYRSTNGEMPDVLAHVSVVESAMWYGSQVDAARAACIALQVQNSAKIFTWYRVCPDLALALEDRGETVIVPEGASQCYWACADENLDTSYALLEICQDIARSYRTS